MFDKLLKQTGICIIIVLLVMMLQSLNIGLVNKGLQSVSAQVMKEYTIEDIKTFGTKLKETIKEAPAAAASIVAAVGAETEYGKPIDELFIGPTASVYAVSGGIVVATGEDDNVGKYLKITHGSETESIYGNCSEVFVEPLERVKKGQIIASYEKSNPKDFYYALNNQQ